MLAIAPTLTGGFQLVRVMALLGLLATLGACGNKGDLFLEGEEDSSVDDPVSPVLGVDPAEPSDDDELLDLLDAENEERERLRREAAEELNRQ